LSLTEVVQAVMAVQEAQKRIPPDIKKTFFSRFDVWIYHAVLDNKLCDQCLAFEKQPRYFGSEIRSLFPYLEIQDENTIKANVHPHCRCFLTRLTEWNLDDIKWFILLGLD